MDTTEKRSIGTVCMYNAEGGWGFIRSDDDEEEDVFVHISNVVSPDGKRRELSVGQRVGYVIGAGKRGPKAVAVEVFG